MTAHPSPHLTPIATALVQAFGQTGVHGARQREQRLALALLTVAEPAAAQMLLAARVETLSIILAQLEPDRPVARPLAPADLQRLRHRRQHLVGRLGRLRQRASRLVRHSEDQVIRQLALRLWREADWLAGLVAETPGAAAGAQSREVGR